MSPTSPDFSAHNRRPGVPALFVVLLAAAVVSCFLLHRAVEFGISSGASFFPIFDNGDPLYSDSKEYSLERVLKVASMPDNTVILTTLNEAWAAPNSVIDLFLESFRIGERTRWLLNHLVIVSLDQKAFSRCMVVHSHCFSLVTEGVDFSREAYFMTPDYLKMMWRRIDFLRSVLEMGYNFVFTDADVMWFRDPFPHFHPYADFQIACDHFSGISDDIRNKPNGGFKFVRSNTRSIEFYKFWHASHELYPGLHDQDVLNKIKNDSFITEMGLHLIFLDTTYYGGFCEPSEDMDQVCTMHANCCFGLNSKLHDLRILLEDWKMYLSSPLSSISSGWRVPQNCSLDSLHLVVQQPDPTDPAGPDLI
ncbi:Nucleotide-diphospho-sugar transferase family protein [Perilla frutescens var. frutescens]|nr:Nucleotide-diphospho-sugar transferase family protein [Perilla frutescens var. frutescens]